MSKRGFLAGQLWVGVSMTAVLCGSGVARLSAVAIELVAVTLRDALVSALRPKCGGAGVAS